MMNDERCLVDNNVLVYSTVLGNPWHQKARSWLAGLNAEGVTLCVTPQILREYLVVLTRGTIFEKDFSTNEALKVQNALLQTVEVLDETTAVAATLRNLVEVYSVRGKRIHDANIVATMIVHNVTRLATYNHNDFNLFEEIVLEPAP